MQLVLASASPARLSVLRSAGLEPEVEVSDVDEDALLGGLPDAVVVGCDSMLHIDGALVGKPADAGTARARWREMAGRTGELLTGHAVLRLVDGEIDRVAEGHAATTVRFGRPDPAELEAYLATGEPLAVAGAFTLDGLGGWFVDGIDGDPSNVIGISLPLTRRLLAGVGVRVTDLWT